MPTAPHAAAPPHRHAPHQHAHAHSGDVGAAAGWSLPEPWRHRWLGPASIGALVVAATAYTGVQDPNTSHAFPLCPLKYATGIDCPACGCLRAVHSLTRGDVLGAADHNLLFVLALPLVVGAYLLWFGRTLGRPVPVLRFPPRTVAVVMTLVVLFAVARNLPVPGHDFLNSATS